ncbi:ExbD/TolR family protein [Halobacteriovorax sp. GFR7]|uniref:ExbD/TolR family protein n=1 Tax=unclassified Halobacteriovorax TaxID=2639665 RepID=UPI00370FCC8F
MYRKPSRKYKNKKVERLNLIPILDSVFIFIFFLLMSANFVRIYEIGSDVPIISNSTPPKKQKERLDLTLKINTSNITLHSGPNERRIFTAGKTADGEYDLFKLREKLIDLKKRYVDEKEVIFIPNANISYEELIKIMDAVRDIKKTDPEVWTKRDGQDVKVLELFNNIIFGDTQS